MDINCMGVEIENNFNGFDIIYKENRLVKRELDGEDYTSGYFDYILKKKL